MKLFSNFLFGWDQCLFHLKNLLRIISHGFLMELFFKIPEQKEIVHKELENFRVTMWAGFVWIKMELVVTFNIFFAVVKVYGLKISTMLNYW
jgi:hypothetical protein